MKTFDIYVRRHLVQGNLVIVSMPLRSGVAAYSWLVINCATADAVPEKLIRIKENAGGITIGSEIIKAVKTVYESPESSGVSLGAIADFKAEFPSNPEETVVQIAQHIREASAKYERVPTSVAVGVQDQIVIIPLKSLGRLPSPVSVEAESSFAKYSYDNCTNATELGIEQVGALKRSNEQFSAGAEIDSSVKNLTDMKYLGYTRTSVTLGTTLLEVELHRSFGKMRGRIGIGAEADFSEKVFLDATQSIAIGLEADEVTQKNMQTVNQLQVGAEGSCVLRGLRTLSEADALNTIGDIDEMTLDELDHITIED